MTLRKAARPLQRSLSLHEIIAGLTLIVLSELMQEVARVWLVMGKKNWLKK
jgi:hypothetical protein